MNCFYISLSFSFSFKKKQKKKTKQNKNKKKKTVLQDCFCVGLCCPIFAAEIHVSVVLNTNQIEEGKQYNEYSVERNPRGYMSMRDYRNLPWQNQQPWERNPNPPRSMRDYRDQWMSAPSYMVPPRYTSTPQPPQPP